MNTDRPRLTIGLPVYNGENYLAEALESLRVQTFGAFELIISDNASTDRTPEIARDFCRRDPRMRYLRQPVNVGPVRNFNSVFSECRTEYFKWAPHDDLYDPTFLEKCIAVLDSDPGVVLCSARTRIIDAAGTVLREHPPQLRLDDPEPHVRFRDLLQNFMCFEIFGVIRSSVLKMTPLLGSFGHADGVLLARLGLHGKLAQVPEALYFNRHHPEKSLNYYHSYREYTVWLDPSKAGKILLPRWRMGWEYVRAVREVPLNAAERLRCLFQMAFWVKLFWKSLFANVLVAGIQIATIPVRAFRRIVLRHPVETGQALPRGGRQ